MLSNRCPVCPVCLSVTLVFCGQAVGWIKMKLGMEEGFGPGHIVLDGDPASPQLRKRGIADPTFRRMYYGHGWMDQGATWYGGMPRPRPHCVRWGPSSPLKKGNSRSPIFAPCLLWPNGLMDQDSTWYGRRPRPWLHCVRCGPSSP